MMMHELIQTWDGESVVIRYDAPSGAWFVIARHSSVLGPPTGGCRMKVYPEPAEGLRDALRLAEGMTYKWAAVNFPFGGGKSVIAVPAIPAGAERTALLRSFGRLIDSLHGTFRTGVDLGTTPQDMAVLAEVSPYIMGQDHRGRSIDPGPFTALGVFAAIDVTWRHVSGAETLAGCQVLIQGVGDVGEPLARLLAGAGTDLLLSDIDEARARRVAAELGARLVDPAEVVGTPCDVFAPCALGAVLDPESIATLACRAVAGSANNQLETAEDAERLHARGILYAPDYIANAGGAIAFGMMHLGTEDEDEIRDRVRGIGTALSTILEQAAAHGESPVHAARRVAARALDQAGDARRG